MLWMDIVMQPQNITKKVKTIALHVAFICLGISSSALFTMGKTVQLTWYEFRALNNYKYSDYSFC